MTTTTTTTMAPASAPLARRSSRLHDFLTIAGRAIYDGSLDLAAAQKLADERSKPSAT